MYSRRSTGIGAAGQPADLSYKLSEMEGWVRYGIDLYQRLGQYSEVTYGHELEKKVADAKRSFNQWGVDDIPELAQYIPLLWVRVGNWYSKAEQLAKDRVLPMVTTPAPTDKPFRSLFSGGGLPSVAELSSLAGGKTWLLPVAGGLLLFLLMRR